jgi:hypothetical protein
MSARVPAHLPDRLSITLWDFSWYTRAGVGEPFADLDRAFEETVDRGYNTVRICAAPLLLDPELGLDPYIGISGLGPTPAGGFYGQRTRWYDVPGGYRIDVRARLVELLDAAARHGVFVILSSWEYQQSPSFATDPGWWDAIAAVPEAERWPVLGRAAANLLSLIEEAGRLDRIALIELHNEVDFSRIPAFGDQATAAVRMVKAAFPGVLVAASWGKPPHLDMAAAPRVVEVAQFHVYAYGVLDDLQRRIDLRDEGSVGFPNPMLRGLLRDDAPSVEEYGRPAQWRLDATVITDQMLYGYDWVDPQKWDLWLYDHYGLHREAMRREIESRVVAVAAWARRRGIPQIVGEGWIGYTPLLGGFEEGPVGLDLAELGVRTALLEGAWGTVLCSNAAPHHPMWSLVDWQRRLNRVVRGA